MRRFLACMVLVLLAACSAPEPQPEHGSMVFFESEYFVMNVPAEWIEEHSQGVYLFRDLEDYTNVNIIPQEIPAVGVPDIEVVIGANLEELGSLINFTSLETEVLQVNGYPAGRVDFTASVYDMERRFVQWYIVDEHSIYTITFTTFEPLYAEYEQLFDDIIASFEPR